MYANPTASETVGRVNRLISAWPQDDTLPAEGYEGVKTVYKKLKSGLRDIQSQAESEVMCVIWLMLDNLP
jgi:SAGA-associated factor 29